jgi:hypothetical protein
MKTREKRSLLASIMAGFFSLVWIAGGIAALIVKSEKERAWILYILSPLAITYGLVWLLVMLHGRRLRSGETASGLKALAQLNFSHFKDLK